MEITSDLFASVTVSGDIGAGLEVDAFVEEDGADGQLVCDVEVDDSGYAAAMTADDSLVGMEFEVDGTVFQLADLVGPMEVSRSLSRNIQTASFSVPLDTPAGPIGNPFSHVGPATCKREISIRGVYRTASGDKKVPIITKGKGFSSKRSGGKSGFVESFEVLDRGARFDQQRVSLAIPAGSGLPRDRVLAAMAGEAGVVDMSLEACSPTYKEFILANAAKWIEPCADALMDVELRKVLWNRDGELANPRFGPPSLHGDVEPIRHTFTEADFNWDSNVEIDWADDQITRVKLTGSAPILRESCAIEVVPKRVVRKAIYAPRAPGFLQQSDGSFDPNPQDSAGADPITVGLDIIEKHTKCGTLIYERTMHYAFYNPECRRWVWEDSTDEWVPLASVYTDDDSGGDGIAMLYPREAWLLTGVEETWHYWLQRGYRYSDRAKPFGVLSSEYHYIASALLKLDAPENSLLDVNYGTGADSVFTGEAAGVKLGTISRTWAFYAPRYAQKERDITSYPLPTWDETEPADGLYVLGNKEAYDANPILPSELAQLAYPAQTDPGVGESLTLTSVQIEAFDINTENYVTGLDRVALGWQVRTGLEYKFGDGRETSEVRESFHVARTEREDYAPAGDSNHDRIVHVYDRDGRELPSESELGADGYLPAAEFIDGSQADPQFYADDAEQQELSRMVHRTESQDLEVEIIAEDLEDCRDVNQYEGTYEHAENDDELERAARAMIGESCAAEVRLPLAGANFYAGEGQLVNARYIPLGLDHAMRVETVRWTRSGDPKASVLTFLEGKAYLW